MEGIKYVNLIQIGPVVTEIRGVKNSKLAVPVNNTLVRHMAFLAADTRPCVLISLVNHSKPKAWHFQQGLTLMGLP